MAQLAGTAAMAFVEEFGAGDTVGPEMPEVLPELAPCRQHARIFEIAEDDRPDHPLAPGPVQIAIGDSDFAASAYPRPCPCDVDTVGRRIP